MFQYVDDTKAAKWDSDEVFQQPASVPHIKATPRNVATEGEGASNPIPALPPESAGSSAGGDALEQSGSLRSLPVPWVRGPSLQALQEWEGYVVAIHKDEFEVRLLDLTAEAVDAEEEATIPLDEISSRDIVRMRIGSIFRWVIGYRQALSGTKERVSLIVFRDLPRVTDADVRRGTDWAREVAQRFSS